MLKTIGELQEGDRLGPAMSTETEITPEETIDGLVPITFSGSSDDLIHCDAHASIVQEVPPDCSDLLEISHLHYGGWTIEQTDGDPFSVLAHYDGAWRFSVGFTPDAWEDGHELAEVPSRVRRCPSTGYSTELTVWVDPGSTVRAMAEGASAT